MSGIAGIIHFDGQPVVPGQIEQMTACMQQRGPDGIRHWQQAGVALGHCLLQTTPESLEEILPLSNEEGNLVLVVDGRVDNWQELRQTLLARGAVLRTRADAELILRAYELWGQQCLEHIDGDFALVIWNTRARTAFCARDRIGNKPFYYYWQGATLVFATDLAPILALPFVRREINEGMFTELLVERWYSREETLWQQVKRLPAAHILCAAPARLHLQRYWQPDLYATLPCKTEQEYIESYRALLTDSVRRLSRTQRPLAIEVSGGLDSSSVFAVAEQLRQRGQLPASSIQGYTMACTFDAAADEVAYARAVGKRWNTTIREVAPLLPAQGWFAERAKAWHDFPGYPSSAMVEPLLAEAAAAGSRVSLNGIGGDEWGTGTRLYYAEELAAGDWRGLGTSLAADSASFGLRTTLYWLCRFGFFSVLPEALQQRLLGSVRKWRGSTPALDELFWLAPSRHAILQSRKALVPALKVPKPGQHELMHILNWPFFIWAIEAGDRIYANHAIEGRSPFSTAPVVQFMLSLPEKLRLRGAVHKYIHVQALGDLLPAVLAQRQTKADFSVAFSRPLDAMQQLLTVVIPQQHPDWVTASGMAELYRLYQEGKSGGWPRFFLWAIYAGHLFREMGYASNVEND